MEIALVLIAFAVFGPILVLLWMKYVNFLLDKFKW